MYFCKKIHTTYPRPTVCKITKTQNNPKKNWQFPVHGSPTKSFCFRNKTGWSSQPLSQKWIMCLLPKLGQCHPSYISWLCLSAIFFLKIIGIVIHLRCTGNLNLAPALPVSGFLLGWDRAAFTWCMGSNSHFHAYPQ